MAISCECWLMALTRKGMVPKCTHGVPGRISKCFLAPGIKIIDSYHIQTYFDWISGYTFLVYLPQIFLLISYYHWRCKKNKRLVLSKQYRPWKRDQNPLQSEVSNPKTAESCCMCSPSPCLILKSFKWGEMEQLHLVLSDSRVHRDDNRCECELLRI